MLRLHLQLFADGAGETGAGSAAAGGIDFEAEFQRQFGRSSGVAAPKKAEAQEKAPEPDAGKGQAAGDEAHETTEAKAQTPEEEDAEFRAFVKTHKGASQRWSQGMLNDRFKTHNARVAELENQLAAYKKAYAGYAQKLGVDPNDPAAIEKAVLDDKSNFRAMAIEQGISVEEAARQFQAQQAQAAQAQDAQAAQQQLAEQAEMQRRQAIYDGWRQEEAEIRKTDPDFDLAAEIAGNAEFAKALDAGLGVRFAYNATHFDSRMAAVAGAVEKQTAISTAQRIAAQQHRPVEGGLGSGAAVKQTKVDYASLPQDQFMELFKKSLQR